MKLDEVREPSQVRGKGVFSHRQKTKTNEVGPHVMSKPPNTSNCVWLRMRRAAVSISGRSTLGTVLRGIPQRKLMKGTLSERPLRGHVIFRSKQRKLSSLEAD